MTKHVVVLDIVGLEEKHLNSGLAPNIDKLSNSGEHSKLKSVFPTVTCSVQASFLSGEYPNKHGIISNGYFDKNTNTVSFWEQYDSLVQSPRLWDKIKDKNNTLSTAVLFWQNTLYSKSDIIVTPKPLHMDDGMIMWCYSKPLNYYEKMTSFIGEFNLSTYWGPLASPKSSQWITEASKFTLQKQKPRLLLTYIPHVDYSAQRFGKESNQVLNDIKLADSFVGDIINTSKQIGIYDDTQFIIFSEYSFNDVKKSISLNLHLREKGLLKVREIGNKEYIDFELSKAFAMVDHQIAHIYTQSDDDDSIKEILNILKDIDGIDMILNKDSKKLFKIDHPRSGNIIIVANKNTWFNYYWWYDIEKSPNFTKNVDIHRKPGYDPLELFFEHKTKSIPYQTDLIKSSHGRPSNIESNEGLSLYVSNKKSDVSKKDGIIDIVNLGKYLQNIF
ncbi:MAG: alkaline phosphatase family protein [Nitrososphaeraceae archaeon]